MLRLSARLIRLFRHYAAVFVLVSCVIAQALMVVAWNADTQAGSGFAMFSRTDRRSFRVIETIAPTGRSFLEGGTGGVVRATGHPSSTNLKQVVLGSDHTSDESDATIRVRVWGLQFESRVLRRTLVAADEFQE